MKVGCGFLDIDQSKRLYLDNVVTMKNDDPFSGRQRKNCSIFHPSSTDLLLPWYLRSYLKHGRSELLSSFQYLKPGWRSDYIGIGFQLISLSQLAATQGGKPCLANLGPRMLMSQKRQ